MRSGAQGRDLHLTSTAARWAPRSGEGGGLRCAFIERRGQVVRGVALAAYAVATAWWIATHGIPLEREQLMAWIVAGLLVAAIGRPWRRAGRVLVDWLPLPLFLVLYDYSRGLADDLGMPVLVRPQIELDRRLFAGEVPTVWLQRHLGADQPVHPWEALVGLVYVSHFILPLVVAGWLYWRDRATWRRYVNRWIVLSFAAVATFFVVPTAPPWMAAEQGELPPVYRVATRGWSELNLEIAHRWLQKGQSTVNLVAAIPSLHAGYAALVAVTFWPRLRPRLRPLLLVHPALMVFTVTWGGEHYVVDALAAYAYIALAYVVCGRAEAWWARRRALVVVPDEPAVATPA